MTGEENPIGGVTMEQAIEYFKSYCKIFCDDYMKKVPENSIAYQATLTEKGLYELAIKAMERKPCSLDDAREDFMFDVYNILDFLPTNNEANQIIDVFDRVTKDIEQESILDKIRAELIQSIQNGTIKIESGNEELFRIIDKYKAESEVSE